jgi:hypothetical protein
VRAHIGWGDYNFTSGMFENVLTNVTLSLDTATQTWFVSYVIPAGTANLSAVQAVITATDGASPPNVGTGFTTQFSIRTPPSPNIVEVPVPGPATGMPTETVALVSVVLLVVGLGIGWLLSRGRGRKSGPKEVEEPKKDPFEEQ